MHASFRPLVLRQMTRAHVCLSERPGFLAHLAQSGAVVSASLSRELGVPVVLKAQLLSGALKVPIALGSSSVFVWVELAALGAYGVLEVELPFAVSLVECLVGRPAELGPASALTRIEEAALGFLCLKALSALSADSILQRHFAPRLCGLVSKRVEAAKLLNPGQSYVSVQLHLQLGRTLGVCRLLLPVAAISSALIAGSAEFSSAVPAERTMKDKTMTNTARDARRPLDIHLELGPVRLSPSSIEAIRPGAIIPLGRSPAEAVLLKTGHRTIASAELVEVEGQLAARILKCDGPYD